MVLLLVALVLLIGPVAPARPLAPNQAAQVLDSSREQHEQQQQQEEEGPEHTNFLGSPSAVKLHLASKQPSMQVQPRAAATAVLNAQALASAGAMEHGARPDMQSTSGTALSKKGEQGLQMQQATALTSTGTGMAQQLKPQLDASAASSVHALPHVPQPLINKRGLPWGRPQRHISRTLAMAAEHAQGANVSDTCLVLITYHATRTGAKQGWFTATLEMNAVPEVSQPSLITSACMAELPGSAGIHVWSMHVHVLHDFA